MYSLEPPYVLTKIIQQKTCNLAYNSNIIASDNVYRCSTSIALVGWLVG